MYHEDFFYLVPLHQPISAHAIFSQICHQNVSPPSGVSPWNGTFWPGRWPKYNKSHRDQGLDYGEAEEMTWCPSCPNRLWQGWSCVLVHCPGGNATEPISTVPAFSDGISSLTPLKSQHSNPNPNHLANQLCCIDFLTSPTALIIPRRLPAFLESLMPLRNWYSIHARCSKSSLKHSIPLCGIFSKFKTEFYCISFF